MLSTVRESFGHAFTPVLLLALVTVSAGCAGDDDATPTSGAASTTVMATTSPDRTTDDDRVAPTTAHPSQVTLVDTTNAPDRTTPTSIASTTTTLDRHDEIQPPPTNPPPDASVVSEEDGGATDLESVPFCDPSSLDIPAIALSWVPEGTAEQLLAISTLPDGFETNRYTVTDELAPDASNAAISPIEPGGIYYWRILSRSTAGWIASEIASFSGPTCVFDQPSSP